MPFEVRLSQRADNYRRKLDKQLSERIIDKLRLLAKNLVPKNAKFIKRDKTGDKIFRIRIGDYRTLYKIDSKRSIVLIAKIDKRPRIYDR